MRSTTDKNHTELQNPESILFIETGESGGGSFHSLHTVISNLDKTHYRPFVALANENPFWKQQYEQSGAIVYIFSSPVHSKTTSIKFRGLCRRLENLIRFAPPFYAAVASFIYISAFRSLKRIITLNKINIIYDNNQINRNLFTVLLSKKFNIPLISHLRSFPQPDFHEFKADIANQYVRTFIAISNQIKKAWCDAGITASKVIVIYNILPHRNYDTADSTKSDLFGTRHPVITVVGRLIPLKRIDTAVDAISELTVDFPKLLLAIIGDGPLFENIKRMISEKDLTEHAVLYGWQSNAYDYIAASDVFVMPSENDGFGLVVLEAMRGRTPIIAANAGGLPEIIEHEKNGLLFKSGDSHELSQHIKRLINDAELCARLVAHGTSIMSTKFSQDHFTDRINKILDTAACGSI